MKGTPSVSAYESVNDYFRQTGIKKVHAAERWGISQFQVTALSYPGRYRGLGSLSDDQWRLIARDLRWPVSQLRAVYGKAA